MRSIWTAAVVSAALIGIGAVSVATQSARPSSAPTFTKDVAPILYKNCVGCHRPGEIGPMPLITFADARPYARSIRSNVASKTMPPWHADPTYGTFRNDRTLSQHDIDTIVSWVEAGTPEGNAADMPKLPEFASGWQIGQPDAVFEMPTDFQIPATGTLDYRSYNVPTNFETDMWVVAAEVRVEDRAHVHHAVVTIEEPGGNKAVGALQVHPIPQNGTEPAGLTAQELAARVRTEASRSASTEHRLAGYAVGEQPPVWPDGLAKRVPAGSILNFSMHYTTNGTPGNDRTKIGLVFSKQPPKGEIFMALINNGVFEIAPGSPNTLVESEGTFLQDVTVWSLHPHMHVRGKDMTYTVIYPDGRREILLSVPKYHFDWQLEYLLTTPKHLPKGTTIHVTAHFDNSTGNKNNPNPAATVHYGDQTWDEMMAGYLTYTIDNAAARTSTGAGNQ